MARARGVDLGGRRAFKGLPQGRWLAVAATAQSNAQPFRIGREAAGGRWLRCTAACGLHRIGRWRRQSVIGLQGAPALHGRHSADGQWERPRRRWLSARHGRRRRHWPARVCWVGGGEPIGRGQLPLVVTPTSLGLPRWNLRVLHGGVVGECSLLGPFSRSLRGRTSGRTGVLKTRDIAKWLDIHATHSLPRATQRARERSQGCPLGWSAAPTGVRPL